MARLLILFVFLFIQFHEQQAVNLDHTSSLDEIEDPLLPSPISSSLLNLWYNDRLRQLHDNEQHEDFEHVWKRLAPDAVRSRQRRRFGNTRYGRSLSNDEN